MEDFVKQQLDAAGGRILYSDLLALVMAERPVDRPRLPRALQALRKFGDLHEDVALDTATNKIVHTVIAGQRPPNPGVSDGSSAGN